MGGFPEPTRPSSSETSLWSWTQATWLMRPETRDAITVAGQRRDHTGFADSKTPVACDEHPGG